MVRKEEESEREGRWKIKWKQKRKKAIKRERIKRRKGLTVRKRDTKRMEKEGMKGET